MWLILSIITNVILLLIIAYLVVFYKKKVNEIELTVKELETELEEFMASKNKKKAKSSSFKEKTAIFGSLVRTTIAIITVLAKIK